MSSKKMEKPMKNTDKPKRARKAHGLEQKLGKKEHFEKDECMKNRVGARHGDACL